MAARLSFGEREHIALALARGPSCRQIAVGLGRSPETIAKKVVPHSAHRHSGTFNRPEIAHKALCAHLPARGNPQAELAQQVALRSGQAYRPRSAASRALRSNRAGLGLHTSARSAEAADRAVSGHREGKPLIGKDDARQVQFTIATGCPVYFGDPHSPWPRGSNKGTIGLLRQYYRTGKADFRTFTQAEIECRRAVTHCPATTSTQGRSERGSTESCASGLGRLA